MIAVVFLRLVAEDVERPGIETLGAVGGFVLQPLQRRDVSLDRGLRVPAEPAAIRGARVMSQKNKATC